MEQEEVFYLIRTIESYPETKVWKEQCAEIGIEDVIIIESDGTKLIAVKRTDIDIDSKIGRELCLADNSTGKANLEWDKDMVNALASTFEIDVKDWGIPEFSETEDEPEQEPTKEISKKAYYYVQ